MRLDHALAFVHFGRCDLVLGDSLAQARLPEGEGIARGRVDYLRGWCYSQLGPEFRPEAIEAFEATAEGDRATLTSHQGPAVVPLAAQHLDTLR